MTTHNGPSRILYVVVTGAGPAAEVGTLVADAHAHGWTVQIIATPAALQFLDVASLEAATGNPVRSEYREAHQPRVRSTAHANAVVVAPATYNTINKLAAGISDTYALGVLAELIGIGLPVVVLPFVNTALAARHPFQQSMASLRDEGVRILLGPGEFEPHLPGTGGSRLASFPWHLALTEVERLTAMKPTPLT